MNLFEQAKMWNKYVALVASAVAYRELNPKVIDSLSQPPYVTIIHKKEIKIF